MTLDQFRCMCAVVETGSFRAAAERVHRSQPAVSQQIKALERGTGHVLIDRRTGRPTPAGMRLYQRASHILTETDSLALELADYDESHHQVLRVGTSDTMALYMLPPIVRAFSERLPRARLVLVNRHSVALTEQVARGELDAGIVTLPTGQDDLEETPLLEQELALAAPRDHPLALRREARLTDLEGLPLLLLDGATRTGRVLRTCFERAGVSPIVVVDGGSFEVLKRYVQEGVGLAILPRIAIGGDTALAEVALPDLPRVPLGVVCRRGAYQTRAQQAFLALLRTSVARSPTSTTLRVPEA